MMLKKMVEEYEIIKGKMDIARDQFGNHHHLVQEYRNQLDNLYHRYFGKNQTDTTLRKEN
ncbi:hypothetical protein [Neobacillus bataviensis]|uniref:hypothetical protein n=1 Tax=Neobacillus bataviensis TaxID=220685 RepID=UPI001CBCCB0D|nr:hypothetical protein [Neobacillus bataviensis]